MILQRSWEFNKTPVLKICNETHKIHQHCVVSGREPTSSNKNKKGTKLLYRR
jgi:hypothetical protein